MVRHELSMREKSIVFVGFMGVGKTTIGKKVAKKLYRDFLDIDEEIEKEFGMSTTKIFEQFGEKAFRERERTMITTLSEQPLHVISVGGGAFMQEEIRAACLANCIVFYLDISWENWKERIDLIIESRPVLQNKSMDEMKELFYKRQSAYAHHHSKVKTDNLNEEEVAEYIVESLKVTWGLDEPR
ncbi:shikimate kinase [Bacillus benzoevorans]|uniref:Shikimate kinase n=1 Tax=Bacillus benzoevorans TaxID=1456 RepID=A0A7X0HQP1_9BACI|nr:shikimate kinase [Bacillus benzoevorans]MBB6444976.1 shikimate kinase [Bacillus benzoevorans]